MSNTHHNHNHHNLGSLKKKLKDIPHKLHNVPPYSDIYFVGNGFKRIPDECQVNTNIINYYERKNKNKNGFMQYEEDIDAEAADFIESRHKKFQLSKTMSMIGGLLDNVRGVFADSNCAVKYSSDPFVDIRKSIVEMLRYVKVQDWNDVEELIYCYIALNSPEIHIYIKDAFLCLADKRRDPTVQLWQEKIGAVEPFTGNLATSWNNIKEEEALERYKLITGNPIMFPEFQISGKYNEEDDWLAASPDGVIDKNFYGLPYKGVLEIKCPFYKGDMRKAYPWSSIPYNCVPQAQGLMEILDRDWMDFYVWTPKGSSLIRIYRDVEYWNLLKMALSDFWWNHVQPAREIYSKYVVNDPLVELKSLCPAPKHELCSYILNESRRVAGNSKYYSMTYGNSMRRTGLHVASPLSLSWCRMLPELPDRCCFSFSSQA
ncbi:restriction endonuclease, type II-like superfamily protein [Artemisia annua]|uniref:Restriction endonuclease, type II-like superfamily protein n=1 Tax=Artemisia annua TaxID=35608 RepID=A0A2U1P9H3_ARTAN|nr:restriction endonuclease, type II-like superfamily protein [Artemisia annua]